MNIQLYHKAFYAQILLSTVSKFSRLAGLGHILEWKYSVSSDHSIAANKTDSIEHVDFPGKGVFTSATSQ